MNDPKKDNAPDPETPRGPSSTGDLPDRSQEDSPISPIIKPGDHRNPNDPPLPLVNPIVDGGNM